MKVIGGTLSYSHALKSHALELQIVSIHKKELTGNSKEFQLNKAITSGDIFQSIFSSFHIFNTKVNVCNIVQCLQCMIFNPIEFNK